jgi:hypothetical protein
MAKFACIVLALLALFAVGSAFDAKEFFIG